MRWRRGLPSGEGGQPRLVAVQDAPDTGVDPAELGNHGGVAADLRLGVVVAHHAAAICAKRRCERAHVGRWNGLPAACQRGTKMSQNAARSSVSLAMAA